MKTILHFHVLILLFSIAGCKKEIKFTDSYSYYYTMAATGTGNSTIFDTLYSKTEVKVFSKEIDFWADKNEISKGHMDFNGKYYLFKDSNIPHPEVAGYWVKISYKDMNNYRDINSYHINQDDNSIYGGSLKNDKTHKREFKYYGVGYPRTTPTKLQLRVYNNGKPVEGAKVYLYSNESQYLNKNNSYTSEYAIGNAVPYFESEGYDVIYNGNIKIINFYAISNSEGILKFPKLEPKQYWFRIEKDGKTNAATKIVTDGALPDDINITTILDIAIQ